MSDVDEESSTSATQLPLIEPERFNEQLQSCGLAIFGDRNNFVWATIARLIPCSTEKLKQETGLSPTQGSNGIHANAVKGLLVSLDKSFYSCEVNPGLKDPSPEFWDNGNWLRFIPVEQNVDLGDVLKLKNHAIGVCYTRKDNTGHCVVYEAVYDAKNFAKTGSRVSKPPRLSYEERFHPLPLSNYKFIDYSGSRERDVLSDVRKSTVKLVFCIDGRERRPRQPLNYLPPLFTSRDEIRRLEGSRRKVHREERDRQRFGGADVESMELDSDNDQ